MKLFQVACFALCINSSLMIHGLKESWKCLLSKFSCANAESKALNSQCVFSSTKKTTPQNPETLWSLCKRNPWSVAKSMEKGQIINKLAFISRIGLRKSWILHAVNIILSFWTTSSKIVWGTTPLNNWIAEKSGEGFSNLFDLFRVLCNYLCAKLFVKDYGLLASQAPNRYTDFVASSNYRSFDNHNYESDLQSANLIFLHLWEWRETISGWEKKSI